MHTIGARGPSNKRINRYRRQRWTDAARSFEEVLSFYPDDGPSYLMLQRSLELSNASPGPDWDGVYTPNWK
jgi:hypothetical protein